MSTKHMALAGLMMVALSGCAVKGGWMGAEAETKYEAELKQTRLTEDRNNDDYYEIHKDGRIYVIADAKTYQTWLKTEEIPLVVTQIGSGPSGETVKMALTKNEGKAMEKKVGFKGGAQQMFEGSLQGADKNFFGFVMNNDTYFVFDNWSALASYRRSGVANGTSQSGGPNGTKLVLVASSGDTTAIAERFTKLHQ